MPHVHSPGDQAPFWTSEALEIQGGRLVPHMAVPLASKLHSLFQPARCKSSNPEAAAVPQKPKYTNKCIDVYLALKFRQRWMPLGEPWDLAETPDQMVISMQHRPAMTWALGQRVCFEAPQTLFNLPALTLQQPARSHTKSVFQIMAG